MKRGRHVSHTSVISRTTAFRLALGGLGLVAIAVGICGLPTQLDLMQIMGLVSWLAAALVLHDGILVPLSHLVGLGLRRLSFGLQPASAAVIRAALLIGSVVTLVCLPLLKAQQVAKNISVLQGDYGFSFFLFWLSLLLLSSGIVLLLERRAARR